MTAWVIQAAELRHERRKAAEQARADDALEQRPGRAAGAVEAKDDDQLGLNRRSHGRTKFGRSA